MNGQYPRFKNSYFYEELTENFLLTPAELEFVRNCRGDVNRQGMAILLKGLQYLGYFPESLQQVPGSIRSFMGKQRGLLTDFDGEKVFPPEAAPSRINFRIEPLSRQTGAKPRSIWRNSSGKPPL